MKYITCFAICFLATLMLTSCLRAPKTEIMSDESDLQKLQWEIEQMDIDNTLMLKGNNYLRVLDINDNLLLLHVTESLEQSHPLFSELGFGELSKMIVIYNIADNEVLHEQVFEEPVYCPFACFYNEGFAFIQIQQNSSEIYTTYDICYTDLNETHSVLEDICAIGVRSIPELHVLDGILINSYFNPVKKEFGIRTIDTTYNIQDIIDLVDDGFTEHISTVVSENGNEFMYFAASEGCGTFYVCDIEGILASFELGKDERIYDYCILQDFILLTMEIIDENGNQRMYYLKDFEGNTIYETTMSTQLFRLASNGIDTVVGIDNRFAPHILKISESVDITPLTGLPMSPVLFYRISADSFLIHYTGEYNMNDRTTYILNIL